MFADPKTEEVVTITGDPNIEGVVAGVPKDFTPLVFAAPKFRVELLTAPKLEEAELAKFGVVFAGVPNAGGEVVGRLDTGFAAELGVGFVAAPNVGVELLAPKIGAEVVAADAPKEKLFVVAGAFPNENEGVVIGALNPEELVSVGFGFELLETGAAFPGKEKLDETEPKAGGG